jgi:hypothetical protein
MCAGSEPRQRVADGGLRLRKLYRRRKAAQRDRDQLRQRRGHHAPRHTPSGVQFNFMLSTVSVGACRGRADARRM